MHDDDIGGEQHGGWQQPEYVSPWIRASQPDTEAAQDGSTISFGREAAGTAAGAGYPPPGYARPGYAGPGYQPPYQQAESGQPGYGPGQPGYGPGPGQAGYGPGYGQPGGPGYGQPWGGYGPPPPPRGSGLGRALAYLAVAVLAAGAGAGVAVALNHSSSGTMSPAAGGGNGTGLNPFGGGPSNGGLPGGGSSGNGSNGSGSNGSGSNGTGTGTLDANAVAAKVNPGVVDINATLKYNNATAAGTGMVISPSGLVLTNNHVIDEATSISAQIAMTGKTYQVKVLGYDSTHDVALLQLVGASGLKTVNLGDSSAVKVGDAVLGIGNAGGKGGVPATAQGTVQALNQSIQAQDQGASTTENLSGLIQTDAAIEEGDSGGPLADANGKVIGMDTAANTSGYGRYQNGPTTGFAIPINSAMAIADQIKAGKETSTVHIGLAGFMGVNVGDAADPSGCSSGGDGFGIGGNTAPVDSGALICQVYPNAPASQAGLHGGDVIISVDGQGVTKSDDLTKLMEADHPGDKLTVVYVDRNGDKQTTTVTLTEWAR